MTSAWQRDQENHLKAQRQRKEGVRWYKNKMFTRYYCTRQKRATCPTKCRFKAEPSHIHAGSRPSRSRCNASPSAIRSSPAQMMRRFGGNFDVKCDADTCLCLSRTCQVDEQTTCRRVEDLAAKGGAQSAATTVLSDWSYLPRGE